MMINRFYSFFFSILLLIYPLINVHSLASADVLAQVKGLMAAGELQAGYELARAHSPQDDVIALKFAQLALLLGHEEQANSIFLGLQSSQQLTDLQKKNMNAFIKRFYSTLKKKIRLAKIIVKKGQCGVIEARLQSLMHYQGTRKQAKRLLAGCQHGGREFKIRLGGSLGFDNNISLTNENLSTNSLDRLEGRYQNWNLMVKSKPIKNPNTKDSGASWLASYFFSTREYDQQVPSRYDFSNHKAQAEFHMRNFLGLDWSMPLYFRYSEYSGQHYTNNYGAKLGMSYRAKQLQQKLILHWRNKSYADNNDQDRNSDLIDLGYRALYKLNPLRYQLLLNHQSLTGPKDRSDQYQSLNLGLKIMYQFANLWPVNFQPLGFLSYSAKLRQYQAVDVGLVNAFGADYDRKREDMRQEYQFGWVVKYQAWRFKTQFQYQQRASNLDVYDFQRHKLELGLQYEF